MQVQIYRGRGRVFAVVDVERKVALPQRYAPWAAFKVLDLMPGQSQPGVNVDECLDDIARYSIHVTDAHVRITEDAIGGPPT